MCEYLSVWQLVRKIINIKKDTFKNMYSLKFAKMKKMIHPLKSRIGNFAKLVRYRQVDFINSNIFVAKFYRISPKLAMYHRDRKY